MTIVRKWHYVEDDFSFNTLEALETHATCKHCGEIGLSAILARDAAEGHAMSLVIHTDNCMLMKAAHDARK